MMIGSGIFVAPGHIYNYTGDPIASLLVWLAAGLLSLTGALCYAELGTLITGNGGEYTYLLEAYGRLPALGFIWTAVTLLKSSSAAVLSATSAQYLYQLLVPSTTSSTTPSDSDVLYERLLAVLLLVLAVAINAFSSRAATRAQNVLMAAKMTAIALICAAGIWILVQGTGQGPLVVPPPPLPPSPPDDTHSHHLHRHHSYLLALQAALWGFDGWNGLNYVTEKVREPERVMPRAIVASVTLVTVAYLVTNLAYLAVVPAAILAASRGMVTQFGDLAFGTGGRIVLPLCISLSSFGALAASLYTGSHLITAAAAQSHFPAFFAVIHSTRRTPTRALLLQLVLALPLVASSELIELIHLCSFVAYLFYGLAALAVLVLRYASNKWRYAERPFAVPVVLPVVFVGVCTWMVGVAVVAEPVRVAAVAAWIALGFALWAVAQGVARWRQVEGGSRSGYVDLRDAEGAGAQEIEMLE
ncbi:amino acid/polyamine transporter I [Blastocladiella britannica]|nr:amino acid/polyamine transporter I [Blastocladiella britannica]